LRWRCGVDAGRLKSREIPDGMRHAETTVNVAKNGRRFFGSSGRGKRED
jgi:hypothetical protein